MEIKIIKIDPHGPSQHMTKSFYVSIYVSCIYLFSHFSDSLRKKVKEKISKSKKRKWPQKTLLTLETKHKLPASNPSRDKTQKRLHCSQKQKPKKIKIKTSAQILIKP